MSGIPAEIPGGKDYKKNPGKKSQEDLEKSLEKLQEVILKELQEDLLEESEQNFQKKKELIGFFGGILTETIGEKKSMEKILQEY